MALAERAAGMGPVTMHGVLDQFGGNRRPEAYPKRLRVYPRRTCAATECACVLERFRAKWIPVRVKKTRQNKKSGASSVLIQSEPKRLQGSKKPASAPILTGMTVHFPFQNSYTALPANFFARVAPTPV